MISSVRLFKNSKSSQLLGMPFSMQNFCSMALRISTKTASESVVPTGLKWRWAQVVLWRVLGENRAMVRGGGGGGGAAAEDGAAVRLRGKVGEVAVVGEGPVAAPELAGEGVDVLERCISNGGVADVGDDVVRLDGQRLQQRSERGCARRGHLVEGLDAPALIYAAACGEWGGERAASC